MRLRAGDWVEVRSQEEILSTLDKKGQLEGLPFMPQMFQYCGKKFEIYKIAHKTCDTVRPVRGARVSNAVHLNIRCDGVAYGGCQAACLIFWKNVWLKPIDQAGIIIGMSSRKERLPSIQSECRDSVSEAEVLAGTRVEDACVADEPRYICQATQVPYFTTVLNWWDVRQYWEDYQSGNAALNQLIVGLLYATYKIFINLGIGIGAPLRWIYDRFQSVRGGIPYPEKSGLIPVTQPTPKGIPLNLKAGELVRIKPFKEILGTLNTHSSNRGLYFDCTMVPFCGGTYRVRNRVEKFIDEKTGKLITLKSDAVILEGVWCKATYSHCRMFCPRSICSWWREIWLERVS